jgi:hypothetical protein
MRRPGLIYTSDASLRVSLETRPVADARLDLLISKWDLGEHLALELKHLLPHRPVRSTARLSRCSQGAQKVDYSIPLSASYATSADWLG